MAHSLLRLARDEIDKAILNDSRYPELGQIVGHGSSADYTAGQPFAISHSTPVPDSVFGQYNRTECMTQMGLFPEIHRSWISVDNRLYFWNFHTGKEFQAYEDLQHPILAVGLATPKPGIFSVPKEGFKDYLLVIATINDIVLLRVNVDTRSANAQLSFIQTSLATKTGGLMVNQFCCSPKTGRIFFSVHGTNDVHELCYHKQEGWFSRRCVKYNRTGSPFESFIPNFFQNRLAENQETVSQICIDDSRSLLYTLSSHSNIRCFKVSADANNSYETFSLCSTYSFSNIITQANLLHPAAPFLPSRNCPITSISPLSKLNSASLFLVAVTKSGCRLYIRATQSAYIDYSSQPSSGLTPSTMQVTHVRPVYNQFDNIGMDKSSHMQKFGSMQQQQQPYGLPRSVSTPNTSLQKNTPSQFNSLKNAMKPSAMNGLPECLPLSCVFPCGSFFAISNHASQTNPSCQIQAAAPDIGRIALAKNIRTGSLLHEMSCSLILRGNALAVGILSDVDYCIPSELSRQFDTPPLTIIVQTNSGTYFLTRRRPIEQLDTAIRAYVANSIASDDIELRQILEQLGRSEACAIALGLLLNSSNLDPNTQQTSQFGNFAMLKSPESQISDLICRCYIDFGGKAFLDQNVSIINSSDLPLRESIRLSGRCEGLSILLGRILRPHWEKSLFRPSTSSSTTSVLRSVVKPIIVNTFVSNISMHTINQLQIWMVSIYQFLDRNRNYIEGLSGPERIVGASNAVEAVQKAEFEGMQALLMFIQRTIEGLAFLQTLFDAHHPHRLEDIWQLLPEPSRKDIQRLTLKDLVSTEKGLNQAKELVNALVSDCISKEISIDSISEPLRRQCGSFCSTDDVLIYKAMELIRAAKNQWEGDIALTLRESLRYLKSASGSLTIENLIEIRDQYCALNFHPGVIELTIEFVKAYKAKIMTEQIKAVTSLGVESQSAIDNTIDQAYQLILQCLEMADQLALQESNDSENLNSENQGKIVQNASYQVIFNCDDKLLQFRFCDWLISQDKQKFLLDTNSPFVLLYLDEKRHKSIKCADLQQQWHAKRGEYLEAAVVLKDLARMPGLTHADRIAYLSLAKGYCGCYVSIADREKVSKLLHELQELSDVANIQDDIIHAIQQDVSLQESKKKSMLNELNLELLAVTELFNNYAYPLKYYEICLSILDVSNYRDASEVRSIWQKIMARDFERTNGFQTFAKTLQSLGTRYYGSDIVFIVQDLLPMIERYKIENTTGPDRFNPYIVQSFIEAKVPHNILFTTLDGIFNRKEPPFNTKTGSASIVSDILYILEDWRRSAMEVSIQRISSDDKFSNFSEKAILTALSKYQKADYNGNELVQQVGSQISRLIEKIQTYPIRPL